MRATATARANIALVKYWGKRDARLNLPARGSLSVTLEALATKTTVELLAGDAREDALVLDGVERTGAERARISKFLDLVRARAGSSARARIASKNAFPTAAGLASSASGFAALALAASRAYGLELDPAELSVLARRGSGSAARSVFGGFVRMSAGVAEDGQDAYAEPLGSQPWGDDLVAAIAVAKSKEKEIGSTDGMTETATTSPYHAAWLDQVDRDLQAAERAIAAEDFDALGAVAEGSCLAMHADAMAARPGILYFGPSTLFAIARVRALRREGVPVFFTVDAGPHVVAFTRREALERVATALGEHPEVREVITSGIGAAARFEDA